MAYANVRISGIIGLKLEEDDALVACGLGEGGDDVLIATRFGKAIRFTEADVRAWEEPQEELREFVF